MITLVVGLGLLALGLAGVRYAPAIVTAQQRQGMTPLEETDGTLEEGDRVRVTRGAGIVFTVIGAALLLYSVGWF